MTHLHIPDGVIPWPYLIFSFVLAGIAVFWASRRVPRETAVAQVPRVAVLAALMVLGQSIPLGFIPFHLNLTVLAGILLGPAPGVLAAVAVNVILALMGHGGITVVGLNSLVLITEIVLGSSFFATLRRRLAASWAAAAATLATLAVSLALIIGVAGLAGASPWEVVHPREPHDQEELGPSAEAEAELTGEASGLGTFAAAIVPVFLGGAVIEAAVTGVVTGYIARVRPDLIAPVPSRGS